MKSAKSFSRPTYWECKRILNRLADFKNLLLYYCPYAGYEKRASKPLSEYIDEKLPTYERYENIEEKISNLVEFVGRDLRRVGISTIIIQESSGEKENIDVFLNIFQYLRSDNRTARAFDMLLDLINRGIGVYEVGKNKEGWRLLNPLYWISYLLKVPVIIIKGADLVSDEEVKKTIFKIYAGVVKALMLIILYLFADKLGVRNLIASIIKLF